MKNWNRILAVLLALAMVFALASCGGTPEEAGEAEAEAAEPLRVEDFASPAEYYHAVEQRYFEGLLAFCAGAQTTAIDGTTEAYTQTNLRLTLDQKALNQDLLDLITQSIGVDMSWLKSLGLKMLLGSDGKLIGGKVTLQLNETDLATADLAMNPEDQMLYVGLPEFSDTYLSLNLEEAMRGSFSSRGMDYDEIMALLSEGTLDAKAMTEILERYLTLAIKDVENVTVESGSLSAGGVTCSCNIADVVVDGETMLKIAGDALEAARSDAQLEKLVYTMYRLSNEYSGTEADFHNDYLSQIEEYQNDIKDATPEDVGVSVNMKVYIDETGKVLGRVIEGLDDQGEVQAKIAALTALDGEKLGVELQICSYNSSKSDDYYYNYETVFTVEGSGKYTASGDLSGSFNITVLNNSDFNGSVDNNSWDVGVLSVNGNVGKDGFLGEIEFTPSTQIVELLIEEELSYAPQPLQNLVRSASLAFVNNSKDGKIDASLSLRVSGKDALILSIQQSETGAFDLRIPGNVVDDSNDFIGTINPSQALSTLMERLQKAGVPAAILSLLSSGLM
jgi:hypothetical protein